MKCLCILLLCTLASCNTMMHPENEVVPSDPEATKQTRALFKNLKALGEDAVLFGHQDDPAYGVHWKWEEGRSDVKEVTGAYPAVMGFDLGRIEFGRRRNIDNIPFNSMKRWIEEGYKEGRVITVSWHAWNPMTGRDSWSAGSGVAEILPGGSHHEQYKARLDRVAAFFADLTTGFLGLGNEVPVIFRPFHEQNGDWFWWGANRCTPEEYIALWRFTVDYLRNEKKLHNLLYAFSTDVVGSKQAFLERYPGDGYVDILGMDNYHDLKTDAGIPDMTRRLRMLVELAEEKGKVAALTETGLEGIPDATWWTGRLLPSIKSDPVARRIAYVLLWRNAYRRDKGNHF